ncbi:PREDICTED: GDSL esterase/lipase At5g55050-like [Lupinus angustifolius]|uniref:GDSL esterase/lipase At5g55050-like n=1 Tax=Lupinus angustifolius TaxID=3871 RepID=UPI00092F5998|nr:PREDICTED: GDSL esterase/lipase At5g55050-like [Lupinus angustifolius]
MEPKEFADYLLGQLAYKIKTIYDLGARKFVVGTANQLGCSPSQFCNESINRKVKPSSDKLPIVIRKLQNQLSGSSFVYVDSFNFFNRIRNAPKEYGFTIITKPCYQEGVSLCANRTEYYFWDRHGHTTEAAINIYANE